ncbi:MAG: MFS transporter [Acidisphaera sp.]|nr:MFS transporter [Acidisphaera sp.]
MVQAAATTVASQAIAARIERLPACRSLLRIVILIAVGGWFEFYELFMPGAISLGLVHGGIFVVRASGFFDYHSFPSFLASFFFGMFLSTLLFSRLSDLLGRRAVFIWSMAVYSLFNLLIALSSSPAWIDLFRFLAGLGVGMQLINNDSFQAEITPRYLRGRYMAIALAFILTAVPISALLGTLLVPYAPFGVAGWRWVVIVGALGGVLVWLVQRGLPESPRWLETHGRIAEADQALRRIEAAVEAETGPLPPPDAATREPPAIVGEWAEMFGARYLPRTLALSVFQFCQTIAVFGFTSWVPIILVERGYNVLHSLQYTFLILLLTPVGGVLGAYFAERFERKWQLVLTAIGIGVFGVAFAFSPNIGLIVASGVLVTLCNNWLISVFHPYAAELFPTRIRAQALGFSFSWSRVSAIFVGYGVSAILARGGQIGVFFMIGIAMLLIVLSIGIFGPRTNGRRLEEVSP